VSSVQYLAMLSVTTSRNDYAIYAELSRAKEYQMEETSSEKKTTASADRSTREYTNDMPRSS
jgi:hypothetical protein